MNNLVFRYNLEISIIESFPNVTKDILMVVKDGYEFVRPCIESVLGNTSDYNLYIWDNGSKPETADYLQSIVCDNIFVTRNKKNLGFIKPNNRLLEMSSSPYVILLNSDTLVKPAWDRAMTSMLQLMPRIGVVGYGGGLVNEDCIGVGNGYGQEIDYVHGYCMCFRRETSDKFGLFDEINLNFAYGEDSDFCFRLRENKLKSYALGLSLVWHKGGATSATIPEQVRPYFNVNHNYLRKKYADYLTNKRMQIIIQQAEQRNAAMKKLTETN